MPLTQSETFKTKLQRHDRLAVPQLLRWRYKMESGELLSVRVKIYDSENYAKEEFLAKMAADGRLTVPKLPMQILKESEEKNLTGAIFEVTINPAPSPKDSAAQVESRDRENPEAKIFGKIDEARRSLKDADL